jgi:hypothetical protein
MPPAGSSVTRCGAPVTARGTIAWLLIACQSWFRGGFGLVHTTLVVVSGGFRAFQGRRLMAMFSIHNRPGHY